MQLNIKGDYDLLCLSRSISSTTGVVPTDNFLCVSPVIRLMICILLSLVPTAMKFPFTVKARSEQTRALLRNRFSSEIFVMDEP